MVHEAQQRLPEMQAVLGIAYGIADQPLDDRVTRRPVAGDSQYRAWCNISIRLAYRTLGTPDRVIPGRGKVTFADCHLAAARCGPLQAVG